MESEVDQALRVRVTDRDGSVHELSWEPDQSLMEVLRDNDLPVLASCGGVCACATCHVYVADPFLRLLDTRSEDEVEMLEETTIFRPDRSRLSCQIAYDAELVNLEVEIAPYDEG